MSDPRLDRLHPRNLHGGLYDFSALVAACPALAPFVTRNPAGRPTIELRLQGDPGRIFEGVIPEGERFELCLCNPPFHASARLGIPWI